MGGAREGISTKPPYGMISKGNEVCDRLSLVLLDKALVIQTHFGPINIVKHVNE